MAAVVAVLMISITFVPSWLRNAETWSDGSAALALTRDARGRMNRLNAAIAHSRLETWNCVPSSWMNPPVAPVDAPKK